MTTTAQSSPSQLPARAAAPTSAPAAIAAAPPVPGPTASASPSQTNAIDAVIDEVLGGDLNMPERQLLADEAAYNYFSTVREHSSGLDQEQLHRLNQLVPIPQEEKDAIFQRTNRVARRILRPLGYKMLQLQGLDPNTVTPEAARAALQADLTPAQQQAVDEEAEQLFKTVYLPEMQSALEDLGVDTRDPEQVWEEFGHDVMMAGQPEEPQQRSVVSIAVPAAVAGMLLGIGLSKLIGWWRQRRQRRQIGTEYDAGEQFASDSMQDDASAYAD